MREIHGDLTRLTSLPTVLVRYGADPAKYDRDNTKCTDNPSLTRGKRVELCNAVLRTVHALNPPAGSLTIVYVGYARSARSVTQSLEHHHVQSLDDIQYLRSSLERRGWEKTAS